MLHPVWSWRQLMSCFKSKNKTASTAQPRARFLLAARKFGCCVFEQLQAKKWPTDSTFDDGNCASYLKWKMPVLITELICLCFIFHHSIKQD